MSNNGPQKAGSGRVGGEPPPVKIRVIEVRRQLADPLTAGEEELSLLLLAAAQEAPQLSGMPATLHTFLAMSRFLQGQLAPFLAWGSGGEPGGTDATLDAVQVRTLLTNPAVRPIITARGAAAPRATASAGVHTRAATRVRALDEAGNDIAIAAEEPIIISGFAIDPLAAGRLVADGTAHLGLDAYAASGAFTAAVYAARGPVRPPEYLESSARSARAKKDDRARASADGAAPLAAGFEVVPLTPGATAALIRQAGAAVNFYFSGAAVATVLARIAAGVHGLAGAPPELVLALGPRSNILAPGLVADTRPVDQRVAAWRDADAEARLRFLLGRLARSEPIAADAVETWTYSLSPLNDLFRVGALGVYLYALTEGRDSPALEEFLERAAMRSLKAVQLGRLAQQVVVASARARLYVMIVEDKLGAARSHAVLDVLRAAVGSRSRGAPGGSLALPADSVQVDDPEAVLAILSKREREVVETEYANRLAAWKAAVTNNCPHTRIARRLRAATSAEEALKALRELEKYFEPAGRKAEAPGWLMCRSCGFRALCPHVRDRITMEARRAPYEELRTRLLQYALRVDAADTYTYYCRLCSERLAEVIEEDRAAEQLGRFGELGAGLRTKIWTVALAAARHVRFPTPTDERKFASAAALAVYTPLMTAETAVANKGRRRRAAREVAGTGADDDDDEIDPRTHLYIVLFVYAFILDLIQTTPASRAVGFAGVKAGAKASAYAERMLRLVAEEHRGIISQIEDITPEFLKARFTEAYRLIRATGEGSSAGPAVVNEAEELAFQTTTVDPIYRYASTVARIAGDLPIPRPVGPAAARREFETVLGAGIPDIIAQARASARDPALAPLYLRRTGVEVPPGGALDYLLKDPRVNLYASLYEPKVAAGSDALEAFAAAAELATTMPASGIRYWIGGAKQGPAKKGPAKQGPAKQGPAKQGPAKQGPAKQGPATHGPAKHGPAKQGPAKQGPANHDFIMTRPADPLALAERGAFFEGYRLFTLYTKGIASQEAYDAYAVELAAYRLCEEGLRIARIITTVKPHYDFGFSRGQQFVPTTVPITAIYDEDGRRHDWAKKVTYYYDRGGDVLEIKGGPAGAKAARNDGTFVPGMRLIDLGCGVCGVRASAIGELDPAKAERSIRAASEINSFFLFYEARCPDPGPGSGLHAWDGAPGGGARRCGGCGLSAAVLQEAIAGAREPAGARAYYDKYSARFADDRRAARAVVLAKKNPPADAAADSAAADSAAASWEADYTRIVRAAELAGVSPATIEAIGSMEGRDYADIIEGRDAPPAPTSIADPRIYTADAEVRLFLADYSVLRNAGRFPRLPPAAADLLVAAGVPKHEYGAILGALPDVGEGYHATFAAVVRTRPPADAYSFAIQSLCWMAVTVAATSGGPEWAARLGQAFAKKELETILRNQKLFSKPGAFNWAIFVSGDDEAELGDQAGDVGEDVLEDMLVGEGEEALDDPYSGENMDYDTSEQEPNNEPA